MVATPLWQNLKRLASIDAIITDYTDQINTHKKNILSLEQQAQKLALSNETNARLIIDLKKKLHEEEVSAQILHNTIIKKKQLLETVTKAKEATIIQDDIDQLTNKLTVSENTIIALWETIETRTHEYENHRSLYTTYTTQQPIEVQTITTAIENLDQKINQEKSIRSSIARTVAPALLSHYESMRLKTKHPVIPIINNACSHCFYTIPTQDLISLKHQGIQPCKSCYHLLYNEQTEESTCHEK